MTQFYFLLSKNLNYKKTNENFRTKNIIHQIKNLMNGLNSKMEITEGSIKLNRDQWNY